MQEQVVKRAFHFTEVRTEESWIHGLQDTTQRDANVKERALVRH